MQTEVYGVAASVWTSSDVHCCDSLTARTLHRCGYILTWWLDFFEEYQRCAVFEAEPIDAVGDLLCCYATVCNGEELGMQQTPLVFLLKTKTGSGIEVRNSYCFWLFHLACLLVPFVVKSPAIWHHHETGGSL